MWTTQVGYKMHLWTSRLTGALSQSSRWKNSRTMKKDTGEARVRASGYKPSKRPDGYSMAMIPLPPDFGEFLRLLNTHEVRYLLVGGYAVGYHDSGSE